MMIPLRLAFALVAACLAGLAGSDSGRAQGLGEWVSASIVPGTAMEARLIAAVDRVGDLEEVPAGLHLRLPDGWKTYWRSPGDAGLPPRMDFAASINLADSHFAWPAPHRFQLFGLETYGYETEVVFPITLTPVTPGRTLALRGTADVLVCADICVPVLMDLALDLPSGTAMPNAEGAFLIDRFENRVPGEGEAAGITLTDLVWAETGDALLVRAEAREPFAEPDVFVEAGDGWAFAAPQTRYTPDGRSLVARLPMVQNPLGETGSTLAGVDVTLTLVDGPRTVETRLAVGPDPGGLWDGVSAGAVAAPNPSTETVPMTAAALVSVFGIAFLGGLILNLMPCVLPVLSIKAVSVVEAGGKSRQAIRFGFLATAIGVIASFLVLAAGAIAVRAAGGAVGWGMQFQQPLFLVFMVLVLTVFACNLLGWFEIQLPTRLNAVMAGVAGGERESFWSHFGTGAFATLLATPCSAPFLGTAVAFALSAPAPVILAVFAMLGIGMATPYLLIAAAPGLARRLPRPGPWMVWLKRLMSAALVGTAVWLLSVMAAQTSPPVAGIVALTMVALAAVLWGRTLLPRPARLTSSAVAGVLVIAAFAVPAMVSTRQDPNAFWAPAGETAAARWQPFDEAAIPAAVAAGRTVFVDVTADWCITCTVNKTLVLDRLPVRDRLAEPDLTAMQADWTSPDPVIADYLQRHGRYGIPFNIVYGPGAPEGIALPELLTAPIVLDAIARAGGAPGA